MGIAWKSLGTGRIGMISTYTFKYGCNARFLDIPLGQQLLDWRLPFFPLKIGSVLGRWWGYLALVISLHSLGKSAETMPSKLFHKRSLQLENLPIHHTLRPVPLPPPHNPSLPHTFRPHPTPPSPQPFSFPSPPSPHSHHLPSTHHPPPQPNHARTPKAQAQVSPRERLSIYHATYHPRPRMEKR